MAMRQLFLAAVTWVVLLMSPVAVACFQNQPDRLIELERIRAEIESLQAQLARIDDERAGLEAELMRTDVEVRLQQVRVAEVQTERQFAEEALRESQVRAAELQADLNRAADGLRSRLQSLYRHEERDLLRSFMSPERSERTLEGVRAVRLLARRDAFFVDRYREAKVELDKERELLAERRQLVEETTAREREQLRRLARTRTLQQRALRLMETRREGVAEQTSDLIDKGEKLSLLIAILANQDVALPKGVAVQSLRGALDWPVRGQVLEGFGTRSEERYRTKIPHNGIEIGTSRGTEVKVVFPGAVVFSSPFEDFGLTVVVHHPDRVFSLYAGLAAVQVAKGDVVSFSDVLGLAQDSVYFEIRVDNRPQDPLLWLR